MSWLSASTYSWGGDGGRFCTGGEGSRVPMVAAPLGTRWKNFRMPFSDFNWMSDSSPEGAGESDEREDNSEESSSAILNKSTSCRGRRGRVRCGEEVQAREAEVEPTSSFLRCQVMESTASNPPTKSHQSRMENPWQYDRPQGKRQLLSLST